MTLQRIINEILGIAKKQPNINHVGCGDIYSLNTLPNIDYSVFYITQTNHTQNQNTVTYNLVLYYVDRLVNNNTLQVQSQGMLVLNNIINILNNSLDEVEVDYNINYTTFTHRFADDCAGVFANLKITADAELGICGY